MYGEDFSLKNVDFAAYKEACNKYRSAKVGSYTNDEIIGLVSKINYLLPEPEENIKDTKHNKKANEVFLKLLAKNRRKANPWNIVRSETLPPENEIKPKVSIND